MVVEWVVEADALAAVLRIARSAVTGIEGALCATVATWADGEARVWVTTCTDVDAVGELCAGPCLETFRSGLSARLASVNSDVRWPAYAAQCRTRGVLSVATSR